MLNASAQSPKRNGIPKVKGTTASETQTPKPHVSDFITVIARLALVLAGEADALDRMQIRIVSDMQEEKMRLTSMLEKFKKYYDKYPGELDAIAAADKEDLQTVVNIFTTILQKNHRRLMVARALNGKMIEAIREAVKEASTNKLYNTKGATQFAPRERLSVTLNQVI